MFLRFVDNKGEYFLVEVPSHFPDGKPVSYESFKNTVSDMRKLCGILEGFIFLSLVGTVEKGEFKASTISVPIYALLSDTPHLSVLPYGVYELLHPSTVMTLEEVGLEQECQSPVDVPLQECESGTVPHDSPPVEIQSVTCDGPPPKPKKTIGVRPSWWDNRGLADANPDFYAPENVLSQDALLPDSLQQQTEHDISLPADLEKTILLNAS